MIDATGGGNMNTERRRDSRYNARWATKLVTHSKFIMTMTDDVSFHGIFLRAPVAPNLGELSRVTVLPFEGDPISLDVVPVRLLRFYDGFGVGARLLIVPARWERILSRLRDASPSQVRIRRAVVAPPPIELPLIAAKR
jgi:hypothetical protein